MALSDRGKLNRKPRHWGGDTQSTADQYKKHVRTVETRLCEVQECELWRHNLIFMFVVRYVSGLTEKGVNSVK
jgi:hypothetical protein